MSVDGYYQFERLEMRPLLPPEYSKVLEVGCGTGSFVKTLKKSVEYWGVEQNEQSAKVAGERLDRVFVGDYQTVSSEIPDGYFDLIVCNDVIEHIEHCEEFLIELKTKLTDRGALVLSVPNVRFLPHLFELLIQKDWRYKEAGILDKTHLRFFTRRSLLRTLGDCGWHAERIEGINRFGNKPWGPKRLLSYLGQVFLGSDTAYLQFAVRARKLAISTPAVPVSAESQD